ncbi:uncharacterized protein LOC142949917 isoform X2 [Anarhichas minor]|uniref:uncharacterized protein LOC142949917 isoform X2 n=1 Tax=Anarhichas minor TaxID=65739 RepID=UPI003F736C4E
MSEVQMLRCLLNQRLTAADEEIFGLFERTIAEYEEERSALKEENERQRRLLDAVFNPQLRLHRADVQQLLVGQEEVPPEQQEWSSSLDQEDPEPPHIKEELKDPEPPHIKEEQEDPEPPHIKEEQEDPEPPHIKEEQGDPEPPHIKEEQEELWTSQEGEQFQGLEEADVKFSFTPVKSEDDEEEAQSSQLHQRQTEQMETDADGEDCGGPEPDRNSEPDIYPEPDTDEKTGDSPDTDDSGDWKETREPQSGLNSLKPDEVHVSDSRCSADAPRVPLVLMRHSGDIMKNSSVTLTCSSDANPAANYTWYKEDEDSPKASGQIFIITDFRAEHSGNYSCEAQNRRGRSN